MSAISRFLTSRWGPILTGIAVGVLAPILVKLVNPIHLTAAHAMNKRHIPHPPSVPDQRLTLPDLGQGAHQLRQRHDLR
jgi:hypothetical protein